MWINLQDNSGENDNYTIVVLDHNQSDVLETAPLATYSGTNELIWKLPWSSRSAGTTSNGFYLGIEYQKSNSWPTVGFDENSNSMSGYYTNGVRGVTSNLNDSGWAGNLGINAIVEIGGSVDGSGLGKRAASLAPALDEETIHQRKAQSIALEPRDEDRGQVNNTPETLMGVNK